MENQPEIYMAEPQLTTTGHIQATPPTEPVPDEVRLWRQIKEEARQDAEAEPALASLLHATVLSHPNLLRALSFHLANKLSSPTILATSLYDLFVVVFSSNPSAYSASVADLLAAHDRDPACRSYSHCLLNYKGFLSIQAHRIANVLWQRDRLSLALAIQSRSSEVFDIDIHPGARIGRGVLLDHGSGIVIGETTIIGDRVCIMHHVTLGSRGTEGGNRHPKIGDDVFIGAGATVLGNIRIGRGARVGAGSLVLREVQPGVTVVGIPAAPVRGMSQQVIQQDEDFLGFIQHTNNYVYHI